MIKSVQFRNFKVLRDATLPLSRFTLIVGPNGSGKSTAIKALQEVRYPPSYFMIATAGLPEGAAAEIIIQWGVPYEGTLSTALWSLTRGFSLRHQGVDAGVLNTNLERIRIYTLDAHVISNPVALRHNIELTQNGANLAGVLDRLRDQEPERFETLNDEVGKWFPEFDRILFD